MDMRKPPFDFFGLGQPAVQPPFQQDQGLFQDQQENHKDWCQWIQGGANAAPAANANIDLNLPADNLILAVGNQGNDQMDLDFDLNADPIEANQEPLNNETNDQDVHLSFNPLDVPYDDISSMDSLCNQLYLYFYDPLNSFSTHASYPPQQPNHRHITTK
jgi:hypothetical protein